MSPSNVPPHRWDPNDDIYVSIGKAISAWAEFEEETFRLYSYLMQLPEEVAAIAFFRIGTFSGKLDLIDKTIKMILEGRPELTHWDELAAQTREVARRRNFIAHSPVGMKLKGGARAHTGQITGYFDQAYRNKPFVKLRSGEIEQAALSIVSLEAEWEAFRVHLEGQPLPSKEPR